MTTVDPTELEAKVKDMYRRVAEQPTERFHFEMGRDLAERLGYPSDVLDRILAEAIESFAGVGYFHDLADLRPGERVIDLGSGSGTDSFIAAVRVGPWVTSWVSISPRGNWPRPAVSRPLRVWAKWSSARVGSRNCQWTTPASIASSPTGSST